MSSDNTTPSPFVSLGNTNWSILSKSNGPGTFKFNVDNTGHYSAGGGISQDFYWWQNGNSFWAQEVKSEKNYLSIMEGQLTSDQAGSGNIVVGQHNDGLVVVAPFTMTQSTSTE